MESSVTRPENSHCDSREPSRAATTPECESADSRSLPIAEIVIQKAKERIVSRTGKHLVSLDILVHPGFVEANGVVSSYYGKQLVTHALLEGMPGVDIRNSLSVRPLPVRELED